ncbi:MAG: BMP family ABC transporter substrate-binding protein [Firmicutes bacterium]|nr:BMP family ABC transporter substrate-binding protein [Bacillota bacterium]
MKKSGLFKTVLILAMTGLLAFVLTSCVSDASPEAVQPEEQIDYEVALITDDSLIMDGGHSEMEWTAISVYCAENGLSHKYYKATDNTKRAYDKAMDMAVQKGAKIVIADNDKVSDAVYDAEEKYKDIKFIILNSSPVDEENGDIRISSNTVAVVFASEEAGYLAGYAAVKDGYENLGFIGQTPDKEYKSYGYGFVMGADKAAVEMDADVTVKFYSVKPEDKKSIAYEKASEWFADGTQVIMASGNNIDTDVIRAAEAEGGKVICCQADKSMLSDTILTTAEVKVDKALNDLLGLYSKDKFPCGEIVSYDAANDGVGLALKVNGFKNLTQKDYKDIYQKLASGKIKVDIEELEKAHDIKLKRAQLD